MEVSAKLRFLRMSPRKVRLAADMIRGLPVEKAEYQLTFLGRGAGQPLLKLLRSAIANAQNNNKLEKTNLFIKKITVDQGPTLKRWRPRAFGRAGAIMKRSSHINLVLDEIKKSPLKKSGKKPAKKPAGKQKAERVVDFNEVKHESKFKKDDPESGQPAVDKEKPLVSGFKNLKNKFSRKLGER